MNRYPCSGCGLMTCEGQCYDDPPDTCCDEIMLNGECAKCGCRLAKWFPHLDYAGEPMQRGEFRDPPEQDAA